MQKCSLMSNWFLSYWFLVINMEEPSYLNWYKKPHISTIPKLLCKPIFNMLCNEAKCSISSITKC
uniref:Uncharacterized protein n=1 Tax=Rhizophora mucronata TaxID=61149 RepID=A0A2P2R1Z7_RHIMU